MYKINDYILYKHDISIIKDIKTINDKTYYIITPLIDKTLTLMVPTLNKQNYIKNILTKEEAINLIKEIPNITPLDINDKNIELTYKELLNTGTHNNLIKIIKTTYLRNEERTKNKKKISERDDNYFHLAETYLYNELAISLEMSIDEVKEYIKDYIENN